MNVVVADPGRKAISNRIEPPRAAPIGAARALLGNHPHFRGRTDRFRISFRDGTLIVEGLVPTFYLKQMLQHALREMRGVDRIEYRVAVVNPAG